jgi:leucyl aminopeptidase
MLEHLTDRAIRDAIPIEPIAEGGLERWARQQSPITQAWIAANGYKAKAGQHLLIPDASGAIGLVALGVNHGRDIWSYGDLPLALPEGAYRLPESLTAENASAAALGWALGGYAFDRYKKRPRQPARLAMPKHADKDAVRREASAIFLVRDLVNTPAEEMGPAELAAAAREVARVHKAKFSVIVGDDLLKKNYPCIHAVGRASSRAPRLIDMRWGNRGPKITLVGKGVCFDSGGLDIKPGSGMALMKKDMGGAAVALALAHMLMSAGIRAQLRVLVPVVENAISGNAYRPGDVLSTRKGLTVEVGNTDAEGRLVLCDALAFADSELPDLIIDFATLTGAARVALGPELPALFGNDDGLVRDLAGVAAAEHDPLWPMPLWQSYEDELASKIADLNNVASSALAGAIFGGLFLKRFVSESTPWMHIDLYAWNPKERPGRSIGGEAQAVRGVYRYLVQRYGTA